MKLGLIVEWLRVEMILWWHRAVHFNMSRRHRHRWRLKMELRITSLNCMHDARSWKDWCRRVPHGPVTRMGNIG